MGYKSIAVHVDTSERARLRLDMALKLAQIFDAHLTVVFDIFAPDPRYFYALAGSAAYYAAYETLRTDRTNALKSRFESQLAASNVQGAWVATGDYADFSASLPGRCADLIVAGQNDPDDPELHISDLFAERLIMSSGRPVLLMPALGDAPIAGTHVLVAWNGSREAIRAVHDALPFIKRAQRVSLVVVQEPPHKGLDHQMGAADIAAVLARHGAKVEIVTIGGGKDVSVGNLLLSQTSDLDADLLVMGAYGHARWQELVLGGATRSLMKTMTIPVLFSH
jgi:nucleotide-binding universal stress UspA family protein